MSKKHLTIAVSILVLLSMLLAACGGGAEPTPAPAPAPEQPAAEAPAAEAPAAEAPAAEAQPTEAPAAEAPAAPAPSGDVTTIRWFIGLGAGGNPEEIERETVFVDAFNAKYGDKYNLVMDIVPNETAYDVLKTQIAAGDVPDIVGPVGIRGLASFEGAWLDLNPFITESGFDLSDYDQALLDFYKFGTDSQLFLPFAVYPSALWYNKALFDEAGLEYPPHEWGAPYADGDEWTWDKLRELALILTVDGNGNDATMEGFDPNNITQFGYDSQWQDIRADWSHIHSGTFVDDEGNAYVPDVWRTAAKWYYDGMFGDYFIPNSSYVNSDLMAQGNTFGSGNLGMNAVNLWFTCCTEDVQWDVAAMPSFEGNLTSKLHADTFGVLKAAKNPQASWEVYSLFMGELAGELAAVYGGFPARQSLQADALAGLQERFPGVDFQVFVDGLAYPDDPSHESALPNFLKASDTYATFGAKYESTPGLDIDVELDTLVAELQKVYDEVQ